MPKFHNVHINRIVAHVGDNLWYKLYERICRKDKIFCGQMHPYFCLTCTKFSDFQLGSNPTLLAFSVLLQALWSCCIAQWPPVEQSTTCFFVEICMPSWVQPEGVSQLVCMDQSCPRKAHQCHPEALFGAACWTRLGGGRGGHPQPAWIFWCTPLITMEECTRGGSIWWPLSLAGTSTSSKYIGEWFCVVQLFNLHFQSGIKTHDHEFKLAMKCLLYWEDVPLYVWGQQVIDWAYSKSQSEALFPHETPHLGCCY